MLENDKKKVSKSGKTIDEATENLKEAIALYYDDEEEDKITMLREPVYMTSLEMAI